MTEEIWKDIKDFEGIYQISSLGRVKSLERVILRNNGNPQTIKERFLKQHKNKQGYYMVSLWKNGVEKNWLLHRLIAEHFIPNPENKPCIDHINTNITDNRVWVNEDGTIDYDKSNLRWCTHKENNNNQLTIQHRSKPRNWEIEGWNHWKNKPVIQLTKNNEIINVFSSAFEAKSKTGICNSHIGLCCTGKRKTAGGYKWIYMEDYLAEWWEQQMTKVN